LYSVEPRFCVLARNLLTKDCSRFELADEMFAGGPEVPLVSKPSAFACDAERLARETGGPDWSVVGPAALPEGVAPDANSGAEMNLGEASIVVWCDVPEVSLVDFSIGYVSLFDKLAQPRRRFRIELGVNCARHGGSFW
jgi:hypothetical protein